MTIMTPLVIAKNNNTELGLLSSLANRHGLITGATGTGKTVTLQRLAEQFSSIGVPVFMADVKGDLSGLAVAGEENPKFRQRLQMLEINDWQGKKFPVTFWDVKGASGHPIRATISDMGPILLARLLNLNDTQSGVLQLIFRVADDQGLLLLDFKDLRAMVQYIGEHARQLTTEYGNISAASIGAIQRSLLVLEEQGGNLFFGEPMLDISDLIQTDEGMGVINILAAESLMNSPRLYSSFLLWMLSELFEHLPEVGDLDKPKLVFFFDEAHLLFNEAPAVLLAKIEQVVRLIRSKGVGIYFVTQNPLDVPDTVLGQLGNRVQHALRAFTPRDQKAVKVAAETLRANPAFDVVSAITELGVGEALVSFLDEKGRPNVVERAFVLPPASRIGLLTPQERRRAIESSLVYGVYEETLDHESAYEKIKGEHASVAAAATGKGSNNRASIPPAQPEASGRGWLDDVFGKGESSPTRTTTGSTTRTPRSRETPIEAAAKSAARAIGTQLGREIIRGVLGTIFGGSKRR